MYGWLGIRRDEERKKKGKRREEQKTNKKKMHMDENMIQYYSYILHKNRCRNFIIMVPVQKGWDSVDK